MKKIIFFNVLAIFIFSVNQLFAQFPSNVKIIKSLPNKTVSVRGNLRDGNKIDDLSWASSSSVACFPATQNSKFRGNHVLYATTIPRRAIMEIKVIPDDKNSDFSLYAYSIGAKNTTSIVPKLPSCVSCEADHKWDRPKQGKTQDHIRSVKLNAINNPYNVVIGVVGGSNLVEGSYTLKIIMKGGENKQINPQAKINVTHIEGIKNKVTTVNGNLKNGVIINDLSWAWNSSNACFPATQKQKFTGNHVLYSTIIPKYSKMQITVVPDDKNTDFSIYAYTVGVNSTAIVPQLPSCINCEADHKWDRPRKGKTQDHSRTVKNFMALNRQYKVVIGVVGANGLKSGSYKLNIDIKDK